MLHIYPRNLTSNKPPLGIHGDNAAANAYGYVELAYTTVGPSDAGAPIPSLSDPKVPENQNFPSEELPLPLKTPPPKNQKHLQTSKPHLQTKLPKKSKLHQQHNHPHLYL